MLKKALVLAVLAGIAVVAAKKFKEASDERELWHEATTAPDHR
ncbi:DLW-39 family protein [Cryptosporangium phraense]|nr:DLW-39 family protein [Cryptosporangium phraense]